MHCRALVLLTDLFRVRWSEQLSRHSLNAAFGILTAFGAAPNGNPFGALCLAPPGRQFQHELRNSEKQCWADLESLTQCFNVLSCELTVALVQYLGNIGLAANLWQIVNTQSMLIHQQSER